MPHVCSIRTCPTGIRVRWQIWEAVSINSLPLPSFCDHAFLCRGFEYDNARFVWSILTRSVLFIIGMVILFVVVVVCSFCLAPSLAVFQTATAFNSDLSKWNTGAVANMDKSKCTLSPSVWPRLPLLCILNIRQLELFHLITILTRYIFLLKCLWTAGSNGLCVAVNGNRCLQTVI